MKQQKKTQKRDGKHCPSEVSVAAGILRTVKIENTAHKGAHKKEIDYRVLVYECKVPLCVCVSLLQCG